MITPPTQSAPAFRRSADAFVPLDPTRSGWDATLSNGSAVAGLLTSLLEAELRRPGFQAARLTVDLLKPVPFAPLEGRAQVLREGGRLRQGHAELACQGKVVARASGLFLTPSDDSAGAHGAAPLALPGDAPATGMMGPSKDPGRHLSYEYFCDMRWVTSRDAPNPAVWVTPPPDFLEGEACSDLVRCVAAADLLAGMAELSRRSHTPQSPVAINADLNLVFAGEPRGVAFGLRLQHLASAGGAGFAHAELFDAGGFRGMVTQSRVGNSPARARP